MEHHHYSTVGFIGGSLTGLAAGVKFFFLQAQIPTAGDVLVKVFMTVLLAAVGGIAGMLAKDIYTNWMKPAVKRFFGKGTKKGSIIYKKK